MSWKKATLEEVLYVCADLRPDDIQEGLALWGVDPRVYLPFHYLQGETYVFHTKAGEPVGLTGVGPWTEPKTGQIWMVSRPELYNHQTEFLRESRKFIELMQEDYELLFNYVDARQTVHLKWLRWNGFQGILKPTWGVSGLPFYEMIRIKPCASQ